MLCIEVFRVFTSLSPLVTLDVSVGQFEFQFEFETKDENNRICRKRHVNIFRYRNNIFSRSMPIYSESWYVWAYIVVVVINAGKTNHRLALQTMSMKTVICVRSPVSSILHHMRQIPRHQPLLPSSPSLDLHHQNTATWHRHLCNIKRFGLLLLAVTVELLISPVTLTCKVYR